MTVTASRTRAAFRHAITLLGLALCAVTLTGCISQGEYDNLYEANRSLENRLAEVTRERDESRAALDLLRGSNAGAVGTVEGLQRENTMLKQQLDKALASLRDMDARMGQLSFGPLKPEVDRAFRELADKYPNIISYDAARGMLRFSSDLTFDSGQDVVKAEAQQALAALGQVLTGAAVSEYEIWVEGHTDSQKISSGTAQKHPTNRHLSAHRAIAVIRELAGMGVSGDKMMAAGWGEYRPAVPNTPSGNTPQNRRVEIYLARARSETPAPAAPANTPAAEPVDITK